jgi:pimeloyl-ACP methyl ester carboxylesterase
VTRRTQLGLAVLALGGLLAVFLAPLRERFLGRTRLRFPYLSRPIAADAYDKLAAKPGWAKAKAEVAPGVQLNGLVRRPSSASAPWVLFFPGNDESQLDRGQAFLIGLGGDLDWGLAVFAYRGYDSSDGKPELASMRADAPEIVAKLCAAEHVAPSRLHIAGFSIGGHFAVHAARGAALRGQRAASLTLLASADDIVMYHPSPWEKLSPGEDYQTRPFLNEVPAPVLVVQGTADSAFNGPQQGQDIARALGSRARYEELPGVDHVPILVNARALSLTREFIKQTAASGGT